MSFDPTNRPSGLTSTVYLSGATQSVFPALRSAAEAELARRDAMSPAERAAERAKDDISRTANVNAQQFYEEARAVVSRWSSLPNVKRWKHIERLSSLRLGIKRELLLPFIGKAFDKESAIFDKFVKDQNEEASRNILAGRARRHQPQPSMPVSLASPAAPAPSPAAPVTSRASAAAGIVSPAYDPDLDFGGALGRTSFVGFPGAAAAHRPMTLLIAPSAAPSSASPAAKVGPSPLGRARLPLSSIDFSVTILGSARWLTITPDESVKVFLDRIERTHGGQLLAWGMLFANHFANEHLALRSKPIGESLEAYNLVKALIRSGTVLFVPTPSAPSAP